MGRRKNRSGGCLAVILGILTISLGILIAVLFLSQYEKLGKETQENVKGEEIPYQQIEDIPKEELERYYFGQLTEGEQMAYLEILQGIRENKEEIYVHSKDAMKTNLLFQNVLRDYPGIFWCDGSTTATAYSGDESYTVLKPGYLYDMTEREIRQEEIDAQVLTCLEGIDTGASDYEKILYVYEYIVNTVDYELEAEDNQNIYSVFVNKRSVCAGYSKAMQYLLDKLGVFCTYVTGKTEGGQSHAWNLVICEGDYYYVDVTWGDPVFMEQEGKEAGQAEKDYIGYDYMCCDDEELFRTHIPDEETILPACTSKEWNYYVVNGMYYEHYDNEETLKVMNDVISAGGSSVTFKYADEEVYAQARQDIFSDVLHRAAQNLAQWYGLSQVRYSYIDDEKLNKIIIYWEYSE
ncbi:transglutaminase domain-containing protein [Lachnospiraceae bacterium 42-17]|jgi:hypothetical protein|nr:hypothetical protein [Dorea sp.]